MTGTKPPRVRRDSTLENRVVKCDGTLTSRVPYPAPFKCAFLDKKGPDSGQNASNPRYGTALPLSCTTVQPTAAVFLAGESPAPAIDQSAG